MLGLGIGTCLLLGALADYAREHRLLGGNLPDVSRIFGWCCIALIVILGVQVALAGSRSVKCPHCKKVQDRIHGHIAIATGYCGYCGEKIFDQTTVRVNER
jgi:hypothetical protein